MAERHTDQFIDALHSLEEERDSDRIVSLFADDAELSNPTDHQPHRGSDGARRFWRGYRDTFQEIHSKFHNVVESDGTAMLEWESEGRTAEGQPFHYDGVSVLEFDGDRIHRFRTYFDTEDLGIQMGAQRRRRSE